MKSRMINKTLPDELLQRMKLFGDDVAAARKIRGITQSEFAASLNVSRTTVSRLEAGDHKVGFGLVVASAWLLGLEDRVLTAFAPENDPVAQREIRLSIPKRVGRPRQKTNDPHSELDF